MKALVYYDSDVFKWEDVATPEIYEEEVLVKVKACGLCSTDMWKAIYHGVEKGAVLGHEVSGEVSKVGAGVEGLSIGDRVAVYHRAECGACYYCCNDQGTLCSQYRLASIFPGAFAEYIRVIPRLVQKSIIKMPSTMSFEEATMIEPTSCCVNAVTRCGVGLGNSVLVLGDGPLGLLNAQVSELAGASTVILSGHSDYRLKMAKALGVDHVLNSKKVNVKQSVADLTEKRGADVVIVAVASTEAVNEALNVVRSGGKICLFGDFRDVPQPKFEFELKTILSNDLRILSSWGATTKNYRTAFDLVASRKVNVKDMITHKFPMSKFDEALKVFSGKECMKIVLSP